MLTKYKQTRRQIARLTSCVIIIGRHIVGVCLEEAVRATQRGIYKIQNPIFEERISACRISDLKNLQRQNGSTLKG